MIVFELVGSETHPVYQDLSIANLDRQYDFLRSIVGASVALNRPMLSIEVICALNFHAISCLHTNAGQFRPCDVSIPGSGLQFPAPFRVPALMAMFVDEVNRRWDTMDPLALAAYVLWRLNVIHPFINGNGRTARVACYFVICLAFGGWLSGTVILPELIRQNRAAYVAALKATDASVAHGGQLDLSALHGLLAVLLSQQLATVQPPPPPPLLPPPQSPFAP